MITHKRMYLILCILHEICYITAFNTNQKIVAHVCNNSQEYFEISEVNQNSCLTKEKLIETPSYSNATIFYKKDEVDITGYQCKYSANLYKVLHVPLIKRTLIFFSKSRIICSENL